MVNAIRGEAELLAAGKHYRLLLTLGALAEIEDGLGLASLADISARLKGARAGDLAVVVAALLRGGGHDLSPAEVLRLPCDLGLLVAAVRDAFARAGLSQSAPPGEGAASGPFAGTSCSRPD
jgi:Phage tail tube protein, GTA-gp10